MKRNEPKKNVTLELSPEVMKWYEDLGILERRYIKAQIEYTATCVAHGNKAELDRMAKRMKDKK